MKVFSTNQYFKLSWEPENTSVVNTKAQYARIGVIRIDGIVIHVERCVRLNMVT